MTLRRCTVKATGGSATMPGNQTIRFLGAAMLLAGRLARTFVAVVVTWGVSVPAGAQILDAPDPAQMEGAPDLG